MARLVDIAPRVAVSRVETTTEDLRSVPPAVLRHMYFHIRLIREVELSLLGLKDQGQVHGPVHSSVGQEGCAVGAMQVLDREDRVTSTHRGHHHFLAKAWNAYAGNLYDPTVGIPPAVAEVTDRAMAEIMGLASGYCRGRGGSMHLGDAYSGCVGTNAIVGGGVPCAAGCAWGFRMDGSPHVAVAFMGDGAIHQGAVHEAMNMAALWKLPVIFFIENNLYAVATHVSVSSSVAPLAQKGIGHGIASYVVDGMDPVAVLKAMEIARAHALDKPGAPVILEAETYRFYHQAQSLPGSAFGYRTKEEEDQWRGRDPCLRFPEALVAARVLTDAQVRALDEEARAIVARAVDRLTEAAGGNERRVRASLFPAESDLLVGVRSDGHEFEGAVYREREDFPSMQSRKFIDVIPEVIKRRMDTDPAVVLIGEEVGNMRGGAFGATKGIFRVHPNRVINTPIAEAGFSGMSLGLSIVGKKPIVELMYPDFSLVAADQIFNQIGKFRYMYGNQSDVPIVFRTKVGIGTGYGAQHSMEPAPLYGMFPGWRVVAPANPFDYVGLFNSAIRSLDPVFVIEHAMLYEESGDVPEDRDYLIELGKARVAREGTDVTLVAYSFMVSKALRAAVELESQGISAEVIDLRSVDYASIDYEAIGRSVSKTGRVLLLEEGLITGGLGAHLSWEIQRRFFDELDGEIGRVAGKPVPVPVSRVQEERAAPGVADIVRETRAIVPS